MGRFQLCVGKATDLRKMPRNFMNRLGVPGSLWQPVGLSAIPLSLQPPHFVAVAADLKLRCQSGVATIPNADYSIEAFLVSTVSKSFLEYFPLKSI